MSRLDEIATARREGKRYEVRLQRYLLGAGIAGGFFVALVGYALSNNGWWFVAPFAGFMIGWRLASGRWRLWRNIGDD